MTTPRPKAKPDLAERIFRRLFLVRRGRHGDRIYMACLSWRVRDSDVLAAIREEIAKKGKR